MDLAADTIRLQVDLLLGPCIKPAKRLSELFHISSPSSIFSELPMHFLLHFGVVGFDLFELSSTSDSLI